jgi:hypothetical protein
MKLCSMTNHNVTQQMLRSEMYRTRTACSVPVAQALHQRATITECVMHRQLAATTVYSTLCPAVQHQLKREALPVDYS